MGGDMHNTIVVAVCQELAERGWMALRFNFRGAGRSKGSFAEGRGERDDVAGAVDFVCAREEVDTARLVVTGYSFGAGVGLHHAARDPRVSYLVGIALVEEQYTDPFLDTDTRPKLFIVGERDPWAPAEPFRDYVARLNPPKSFHVIPHTDHFFGGREGQVATRIGEWLDERQGNNDDTGS
jgi:alpha/beta superfamily hydrolase